MTLVATRTSPLHFVSLARKLKDSRKGVQTLLLANSVVADARMALDLFRLQSRRVALLIRDASSSARKKSGMLAFFTSMCKRFPNYRLCSSTFPNGHE